MSLNVLFCPTKGKKNPIKNIKSMGQKNQQFFGIFALICNYCHYQIVASSHFKSQNVKYLQLPHSIK